MVLCSAGYLVRNDIVLHDEGNIGLAVRKENTELLTSLNEFISTEARQGTALGNMLFTRYYDNTKWILNPITRKEENKLIKLQSYFKKYAKMYHFDWLKIAARSTRNPS